MQELKFKWLSAGYCKQHLKAIDPSKPLKEIDFPSYFGIIEHPTHGIILYDTGYTEDFYEVTKSFPEKLYAIVTPVFCKHENGLTQLRKNGIDPKDVKYVFISHLHADHMCGLRHFENAKYIYSKDNYDHVSTLNRFFRLKNAFLKDLLPSDFLDRATAVESFATKKLGTEFFPFEAGYDILGDGSLIAVELVGHTRGHMGLALKTEKGYVLLAGDAVWSSESYRQKIMPHAITKLIIANWEQYAKAVNQLNAAYVNNKELYILPSHCNENKNTFV